MAEDSASRRKLIAAVSSAGLYGLAGCTDGGGTTTTSEETPSTPQENSTTIFVSPDGDDDNAGTQDAPVTTIQTALQTVGPGETVHLLPGEYRQTIQTVQDGEPDNPITVTGSADAVLRPSSGSSDAVTITHHHFHLRGITINGLLEPDHDYEDYNAWVDRCVFITPTPRYDEGVEYVTGAVIEPAKIGNSAKAMIQTIRTRDASIGDFEVIGPAGMQFDPRVENYEKGHIREIVYIGNAEVARGTDYYPYETLDKSRNIRVHHIDNSAGYRHNELVDIKLGSTDITVEYCTTRNGCHNSEGTVDAVITIQGNDCTVRWNDIQECPLGVGFGSWAPSDDVDGAEWSQNNAVYGNTIRDFAAGPFRLWSNPERSLGPVSFDDQRVICGNEIERGDPPIDPWVPETNGYESTVADRRGQDEAIITVEERSNQHQHHPAAIFVDPDTTVTWEWDDSSDDHYIVRDNRWLSDSDIPGPINGPQSHEHGEVGMYRWACSEHYEEGERTVVIVTGPEDRYSFARNDCSSDVEKGDGIGHTGGNTS